MAPKAKVKYSLRIKIKNFWNRWTPIPERRREGCVSDFCRRDLRHGECENCHQFTCDKTMIVSRSSGKRHYVFACHIPSPCAKRIDASNRDARVARTYHDWEQAEDGLPDQYPSVGRTVIREALKTDDDWIQSTSSPSALNSSISSLGLDDKIYAEQRSKDTFIRKAKRKNPQENDV